MAIVAHRSIDSYPILSAGALTATLAVRETDPASVPKPRLLDRVREAIRTRRPDVPVRGPGRHEYQVREYCVYPAASRGISPPAGQGAFHNMTESQASAGEVELARLDIQNYAVR